MYKPQAGPLGICFTYNNLPLLPIFSESIDKIDVVSYNEVEEILVVSELRESALSGCGVVKSSFNGIYQFKQIQLH